MEIFSKLFKGDRVIWIVFMFLCLISVLEVFSATSTLAYRNSNIWEPIIRHATFLLIGFGGVLLLHNLPTRFYAILGLLLPVSFIMLLLTFFIGVEINGEVRWMDFFGIRFQPSEIAKLSAIGYTALILSKRNLLTDKQMFWWIVVGVGSVCALIITSNGSTAILLFSVVYMMMFIGQIRIVRLLKLAGFGIVLLVVILGALWVMPASITSHLPERGRTWKERIERYTTAKSDGAVISDDGKNYQVVQAKIAIARSKIIGLPGHGQQRDFLPQAYSDFIYAIIIEEMGLVGGFFVLLLYIILLVRVGIIARRCEKLFPKYLVMGCGLLLVVQALTNMAVAVDLIPVTGQPLPLISRGGTSTVISCAYIGIILSVSRYGAHMGEGEESSSLEEPIKEYRPDEEDETLAEEQSDDQNPLDAIRVENKQETFIEEETV